MTTLAAIAIERSVSHTLATSVVVTCLVGLDNAASASRHEQRSIAAELGAAQVDVVMARPDKVGL